MLTFTLVDLGFVALIAASLGGLLTLASLWRMEK
jgi:hypothetical protein